MNTVSVTSMGGNWDMHTLKGLQPNRGSQSRVARSMK